MITGTERKLIIVYILGTQTIVDFLQLFLETARGMVHGRKGKCYGVYGLIRGPTKKVLKFIFGQSP